MKSVINSQSETYRRQVTVDAALWVTTNRQVSYAGEVSPLCPNQGYKDDTIGQSMTTTMMDVVKAHRSLRASYNIDNKVSTHFFIMESAERAAIAPSQNDDIVTLRKGEKDIPESVGVQVVDDTLL